MYSVVRIITSDSYQVGNREVTVSLAVIVSISPPQEMTLLFLVMLRVAEWIENSRHLSVISGFHLSFDSFMVLTLTFY